MILVLVNLEKNIKSAVENKSKFIKNFLMKKRYILLFFVLAFFFNAKDIRAEIYYETTPDVQIINSSNLEKEAGFLAYGLDFRGGVNITKCDIDNDGIDNIVTGAGVGGGPHVRVFDKFGEVQHEFFAFHPDFHGGIDVGCGNINNTPGDEIIVSQKSKGQAWIKAYSINNKWKESLISEFLAYDEKFEGGSHIAAGDIDNDGRDEIITGAGVGGGPHVRTFNQYGEPKSISFFPFPKDYRGGVDVSAGDVDGDNEDEIILAANKFASARVKIYKNNNQIIGNFIAYQEAFQGGVNISTGDYNNDSRDEIITAPNSNGGPFVRVVDYQGTSIINSLQVYDENFRGGINGIIGNFDSDKKSEIVTTPLTRKLKFRETIGYSVENRPIEAFIYGDGYKKILFVGGTHAGTEGNAVELMNMWNTYLSNNIHLIPDYYQVVIIPVHNPDGQAKGIRYNARGVDLNRNFATINWSSVAYLWSKSVSGGEFAFSEPENSTLKSFIEKERIEKLISYHSAADQIFASEIHPGTIYGQSLDFARYYNSFANYGNEDNYRWTHYPISGDLSSWVSQQLRIPALTVELSDGVSNDWEKNLEAMINAISY